MTPRVVTCLETATVEDAVLTELIAGKVLRCWRVSSSKASDLSLFKDSPLWQNQAWIEWSETLLQFDYSSSDSISGESQEKLSIVDMLLQRNAIMSRNYLQYWWKSHTREKRKGGEGECF